MKHFWLVMAASWLASLPVLAGETGPLVGTTEEHNKIRQRLNDGAPPVLGAAKQPVPLPPLQDFVWDDEVAATAQQWADQCSGGHESGIPYGENIAWGFTSGAAATRAWAGEVATPGYDYDLHQCPPPAAAFPGCAHYTAVAWSTTRKLGCGYNDCDGTRFYVCRYDPPGNRDIRTTRPYCTATQTTGCEPGPEPPDPPDPGTPTLSSVAGLIVPGFEVEVADPEGLTTLWAVRNTSDDTLDVEIRHYGKRLTEQPLRADVVSLGPQQTRTVDVRGNLDDLDVADGFAAGLIAIAEAAAGAEAAAANLEGDYFRIDPGNDSAAGDRLVRATELCQRQEVRFADFGAGTELRILLDDPQGEGVPSFAYEAYSPNGSVLADDEFFTSDHLSVIDVVDLVSGESFGTLVFDFRSAGGGFVTARYSAFGRYSIELDAACLDD